MIVAGAFALLVAGGRVEVAGAEVGAGAYPTSQAVAADAQFLEYAPPPAQPGIVCLVDSGVDSNPDTQGVVVGAEAVVPDWPVGDGLAQTQPLVDGHPNGHGTEMAMLMAAPQNGWGMVGIAPSAVRVYSIRVVAPGRNAFPFAAYTQAVIRCLKLRDTTEPAMSVINLALGGTSAPTSDDLLFMRDAVDIARNHGMNVVSAAGNDGGMTTYPAAYPPVLSVGAGDAGVAGNRLPCGFSGGNGLDITAPGCDSVTGGIDEAFEDDGGAAVGFGTSQAASIVAAVIAAMRGYSPAISHAEAELCVTQTERSGGVLDVRAAFDVCGLGDIVQAGLAGIPSVAAPSQSGSTSDALSSSGLTDGAVPSGGSANGTSMSGGGSRNGTAAGRPAKPSIKRVSLHRGRLVVSVLPRPAGTMLQVEVLDVRRHHLIKVAQRTGASNTLAFRIRSASAVRARFIRVTADRKASQWSGRGIG